MTNRESNLKWTRKKTWGSTGMTYRTSVTSNAAAYTAVVDQPRKGEWNVRIWANGYPIHFRQADTAIQGRALAEDFLARRADLA